MKKDISLDQGGSNEGDKKWSVSRNILKMLTILSDELCNVWETEELIMPLRSRRMKTPSIDMWKTTKDQGLREKRGQSSILDMVRLKVSLRHPSAGAEKTWLHKFRRNPGLKIQICKYGPINEIKSQIK